MVLYCIFSAVADNQEYNRNIEMSPEQVEQLIALYGNKNH